MLIMSYYTNIASDLEEKTEADPLVVFVISSLQGILSLIHPWVSHIKTDPLPEGAGDGVGGVDPAVGVQNVLGTANNINFSSQPASQAVCLFFLASSGGKA